MEKINRTEDAKVNSMWLEVLKLLMYMYTNLQKHHEFTTCKNYSFSSNFFIFTIPSMHKPVLVSLFQSWLVCCFYPVQALDGNLQ